MTRQRWHRAVAALAASGWALQAQAVNDLPGGPAVNQLDLHPPASKLAADIITMHDYMLIVCLVIFIAVFGVMFYSIFKHRKSKGHQAANFHESVAVEIAWTVVPFLIVIGMGVAATKTVVAQKDTSNADLTIKATGYQWKWGYDYLQEGISFYSTLATPRDQIDGGNDAARAANPNYLVEVDNPVVVPVGKKVRIITTANDVIHAWWVPALGIKQDAIPGFVRDTWFKADNPGTYRGQCAELCGKDHGFMPIVVEAVAPEQYAAWVADQQKRMSATAVDPAKQWTLDELKAHGAKVYANNCVACHQATGVGLPKVFPALSGSKVVTGPKDAQVQLVLNGKAGTAMAPFKHLSDADIAAVITYTRNNWANQVGDAVAPAEVKALRK